MLNIYRITVRIVYSKIIYKQLGLGIKLTNTLKYN